MSFPPSRIFAIVIGLLVAAVVILLLRVVFDFPPASTGASKPEGGPSRTVIGGPFTLVDHNGKTVTERDFAGRSMLIYFGFTYCPDVCPNTLTVMGEALNKLGDKAASVVPILVTVDPERDTAEHLKEYVRHFHPRLVALTGTTDQVADVSRKYRVYYAKVRPEGAGEQEYLMDHTSIIYLMGPDGQFRTHFSHGIDADGMVRRLKDHL
ncbi:MAG: SCO family protein [Rhodospirillales bacterium]|nr:SCO family protein [Rhodospirillales bacterium]